MYKEVNTGTNLPAQIDLYTVDGDEYKFLCIAKGGGSANKTYLYQETKALLTPGKLKITWLKDAYAGYCGLSAVSHCVCDRRNVSGSYAENGETGFG
jgi:tartrate dehydratase alpha subunit/fumarate hydratase class I-like protein